MKHRRNAVIQRSISVKLNILIVTMILIVSALLILISDRTYRRTVLETSAQKLNSVEVTEDAFVPVSDHFSKVFQTDAFREAKAKSKSGAACCAFRCHGDCRPAGDPGGIPAGCVRREAHEVFG